MEETRIAGPISLRSAQTHASAVLAAVETARTIIDVERVDFCYRASRALHDINLQIPEKKVTAFIK